MNADLVCINQENDVYQYEGTIGEDLYVFEYNGQPWTTSLSIAKTFNKLHKNILRKIDSLNCREEFLVNNFIQSSYKDNKNEMRIYYEISLDGFIYLLSEFSGKKILEKKMEYINKFTEIRNRLMKDQRDIEVTIGRINNIYVRNKELIDMINNVIPSLATKTELATMEQNLTAQIIDIKNYMYQDGLMKRKQISKENKRNHIKCLHSCYNGMCPLCSSRQIVNGLIPIKNEFSIDHMRGPHENALDKTWPICMNCNHDKYNGKISDDEIETSFKYYQLMLTKSMSRQIPMFVCEN